MIRFATHFSIATLAITIGASASAAVIDSSFTNLDFDDAPGVTHFPNGFDASPDIPGWEDASVITDAGVESVGAWWSPLEGQSAFLQRGNAASNTSSYVIQSGDIFDVSFFAKTWDGQGDGGMLLTLYYDNPTNVIGTFDTGGLNTSWTEYTPSIAATAGSVGGTLGVLVENNTTTGFLNFDEISIDVVPEPSSLALLGLGGLMMARRRRG